MSAPTLLTRYAQRLGLTPESARRRLFFAAAPFWRSPFMRLLEPVFPDAFQIDWSFIDDAGRGRSVKEVEHAVEIYHYRTRGDRSFIRGRLALRVSGRRVLELARELFEPATPAGALKRS